MFSGQGSQYYHMGKELFDRHPVFTECMEDADRLVRHWLNCSIVDEIYSTKRRKSEVFDETRFTHPAIFAVSYAMAQVLLRSGIRPACVLGASLGELTAAAVAGVIEFDTALELICHQAEQLEVYCRDSGGMLAILGPRSLYEADSNLFEGTTLAAMNYDHHFVIAGSDVRLHQVEQALRQHQVVVQRLPVRYGFHSPEIDPLEPVCRAHLEEQTYLDPVFPLVYCSTADRVESVSAGVLWNSVRLPIRFQETIEAMERNGSSTYVDLGPSGTLATLTKYNLKPGSDSRVLPVLTPFGRDLTSLAALEFS